MHVQKHETNSNKLNWTCFVHYAKWMEMKWTEQIVYLLCTIRALQPKWTQLHWYTGFPVKSRLTKLEPLHIA